MPVATLTSEGQLLVPQEVRDDMHLIPGSTVMLNRTEGGDYLMTTKHHSLQDLYGIAAYDGPTITIEQMNQDIADAAAEANR